MNSANIRLQFRQIRRQLPEKNQSLHASLLKQNIDVLLGSSKALKIAAYIATQGEISLKPWLAENTLHQIFLPKLYEVNAPELRFAELAMYTRWELNRVNILEPEASWENTLLPQQLDIVLIPLVAFDREGHRLGMGGGYYDRSLAFKLSQKNGLAPTLIGVAHSCQEHPQLPYESWDVPLDSIITEKEIITAAKIAS